MITSIEKQPLETMHPETDYKNYEGSGGCLSESSYNTLTEYTKNSDIKNLNNPTVHQAKYMATANNIYIPESAILTYGILREGHLEKINEEFKKFKFLSDQEVFAETLLIESSLEKTP